MITFRSVIARPTGNDVLTVTTTDTVTKFYRNGKLHGIDGGPAIIYANGTKHYYRDGKRHRDGGLPAIEYADGTKAYYRDGKLHRDGDLPAIEHADGKQEYWVDGKRHRDNDMPAIVYANGTKRYYKNGKRCTRYGTPFKYDPEYSKNFVTMGLKHRSDAPAVVIVNLFNQK